MSSRPHSIEEKSFKDEAFIPDTNHVDPDAEFGGPEERRRLERKLLWKLDCRMSVMVLIYILNYVRQQREYASCFLLMCCADRQE